MLTLTLPYAVKTGRALVNTNVQKDIRVGKDTLFLPSKAVRINRFQESGYDSFLPIFQRVNSR